MKQEFFEIDGLKIFTRIAGMGKPFLILHGWGVGHSSWVKVQDILKQRFQVIALDLPGFGKSDLPKQAWDLNDYLNFVFKFLEHMEIKNCYLLGQSFGGRIAIKAASKYPQKINKLILVSAAGIRPKKSVINKFSKKFKQFSFLPGYNLLRKIFYKIILKNNEYLEELGIKKEIHQKVVSLDLTSLLEKIEIPTLIVWGKNDKITPLKHAYLMNKKIKNSFLEILPCGHSPHREYPEKLAEKIFHFLK